MNGEERLDIAWVLISAALVLLMQAGFLCLETGFTRSKNSINVAIKNLSDFAIASLLFALFGFSVLFGASRGGWLGPIEVFGAGDPAPRELAFFLFQLMFCATATTIVSGAVAERMRFAGYLLVSAVVSGVVYTVFGHWAWNGIETGAPQGWLGRLGFVDFAGSTVVHGVAGWSALAAVMILGAREERFDADGHARAIQGHNLPFAMLGAILLWIGWLGFNGGSTRAMDARVPGILINTVLSGCAGLVTALSLSWARSGRSDVVSVVNGSLAGCVAITAGCHAVGPVYAIAIGGVGGLVMVAATDALERAKLDDVVGAVPVHAAAGLWGTLAVALFGDLEVLGTGLDRGSQLGVQLLGSLVCFAWTFGVVYLLFKGIDRVFPLRVTPETERIGLNVAEHGATSELRDLLVAMDEQARTGDLALRAPEEPFTEVGQIASRYNDVMNSLETAATHADRIKNEFVSTVSHELRTPLTSIHASLGLLAEGAVGEMPGAPRQLIEIARTNSGRLVRLINDLLDIQKIEAGRTEYHLEVLPIGPIALRAIADVRALGEQNGILIELRDDAPGARVEVDPDRLIQVVTNLLSNAIKFSPPRSSVNVVVERQRERVRLTVRDRGPGVPEATRERIFEKFVQGDGSDSRARGGTGLGLSICKAIISEFGGRINFRSQPGQGAEFFFELDEVATS